MKTNVAAIIKPIYVIPHHNISQNKDLKPPPSPYIEALWISVPFRVISFALPYFAFPYLIGFLDKGVTMRPDQLSGITSNFGPGVSILYGTFISLTLSILYERQKDIQNDAAMEASLLALTTRNLLNIFRCDRVLSVKAGQSCADQIRILAKGSRGNELLAIMYSDPYARMLELIYDREYTLMNQNSGELGGEGVAIASCRETLQELFKIRADRLSDESLALPPTHFLIMTILTGFILLGYAIVSSIIYASTKSVPVCSSSFVQYFTRANKYSSTLFSLLRYFKKKLERPSYCRRCNRDSIK
jgi:hypothetical protein